MRTRIGGVVAVVVAALIAVGAGLLEGSGAVATGGPCNPVSPGVSAPERDLLAQVNSWRANAFGAPAMPVSGPANAAAQWFAEAMIADTTQGHVDQYGRDWGRRLEDCGFPGVYGVTFGAGEALAGFGSSDPSFGSTPGQALGLMVQNPLHQNAVNAPVAWACAGVGYASNPAPLPGDLRYAWVVLGVQVFDECPASADWTPTPSPPPRTPTPTVTSPPPTPTPTQTPAPTPATNRAAVPLLARE
ncbi:MAG: CAP domain-containing protein [Dehalococcoidia bacterium]